MNSQNKINELQKVKWNEFWWVDKESRTRPSKQHDPHVEEGGPHPNQVASLAIIIIFFFGTCHCDMKQDPGRVRGRFGGYPSLTSLQM